MCFFLFRNLSGNPLQCGCPSAWLSTFIRAHSGRVQVAASCLASDDDGDPVAIPLEDDEATQCGEQGYENIRNFPL